MSEIDSQKYGVATGICLLCGLSTDLVDLEHGETVATPFGASQFWNCRDRAACEERQARNAEVKEVESAKLDSRIPREMLPRYSKR